MSRFRFSLVSRVLLALAVIAPLFAAVPADARAGGGFSFGSRGARTFSMPSATATAPRSASPFQRTETPRYGDSALGGSGFAQPRRFGFGTGLAAGLLGAGLFGMLTGHGFFGGIGGLFSMIGLLIQIGLIVLLVRFALGWFRGRSGAAFAGPGGPIPRSSVGSSLGGMGYAGPQSGAAQRPLTVGSDDYAAFERLLSDVQYAYAREDTTALGRIATPEMARNFAAEIEDNRRRSLRNDMADVRLLQGDLAESWQEGNAAYATVAMRFSARDVMLDRGTGRIVGGDPATPVQATELWTFVRINGGPWMLSGIQQAA